ncbi:hypothetical protein AAG906_036863 [Vitis piasezkii]
MLDTVGAEIEKTENETPKEKAGASDDLESKEVEMDGWLFGFTQLFRTHVGIDPDVHIDLHEFGMGLCSEALEETMTSLSKSQVAAEDDMNVPVRNLPETENKDLYEVSDPSRVEIDSSVAVKDDCTGLLAGIASGIGSPTKEPKLLSVDAESSVQCSTTVEDDQTKVLGENGSGVKSETLQVKQLKHIK